MRVVENETTGTWYIYPHSMNDKLLLEALSGIQLGTVLRIVRTELDTNSWRRACCTIMLSIPVPSGDCVMRLSGALSEHSWLVTQIHNVCPVGPTLVESYGDMAELSAGICPSCKKPYTDYRRILNKCRHCLNCQHNNQEPSTIHKGRFVCKDCFRLIEIKKK